MPFNRLEELQKLRSELPVIHAQLYKLVRELSRAKANYRLTRMVEIQHKILPPLQQHLHELQKREYRLMTKAELKQRAKNSERIKLISTFDVSVFRRNC